MSKSSRMRYSSGVTFVDGADFACEVRCWLVGGFLCSEFCIVDRAS